MNRFKNRLIQYSSILLKAVAFLLSAVLLYLILPSDPKFKFEYQKGTPWKHENLVAPFDFAILRSEAEIAEERKEVVRNFIPYFVADTLMVAEQSEILLSDLFQLTGSESEAEAIFNLILPSLRSLYQFGILAGSPEGMDVLADKPEISMVSGNQVTLVPIARVNSEKSAYNLLRENLNLLKRAKPEFSGVLNRLDPGKYITSNLRYDENYSKVELQRAEAGIATARGMVQTGERIILEGEIIDEAKFQLLESLKYAYESKRGEGINSHLISIGKFIIILVFLVLLFTYLYTYKRFILNDIRKLYFLLSFLIFVVFLAQAVNEYPGLHIYMVPLAMLPVVIRTFYDPRTAIFSLIITILLIGFYAPNNYEFVLLEVTAGMVAVFSLNKMHRRSHVIGASLLVGLTYLVVFTAITLIQEGTLLTYNYNMLKWFALSSLFILVVFPLIYIFEKLFGFVSDVTLIELSNTNQPLLRKLAEEAPGTFQHSLQIANLAEEVILHIGGNPFLVRAGALYHDIGKSERPGFFIENQELGLNPHDKMNSRESAEVIIEHVNHGIRIARKNKLPESIIEFIATHHGTTKAKYFYLKHKEENPNSTISEVDFSYPGPLPRSREAAVVMLIDGIEAASRSMPEKSIENLQRLIDEMVDQKLRDGQLNNSDLTFNDISRIKEILLKKISNIYHLRIEYPKEP